MKGQPLSETTIPADVEMDAADVEALAVRMMSDHGLSDWTFKWSRRSTAMADCTPVARLIRLSRMVAWTEMRVRQTMLHELAHALTGYTHHNETWLAKAIELGYTGWETQE